LEVVGETAVGEGSLRAEVGVVEPMGNEQIVYLTVPSGGRVVAVAPVQPRIVPGEKVSVRVRPEGLHIFEAQTGKRIGK
jgi:ABC-type sugar transport system ATPase subunit